MVIAAGIVCVAFAVFIIIRQVRGGHNQDGSLLGEAICNEAERKYPCMEMADALDLLYREYGDKLSIARSKGEGVTELIETRQIIARERAQQIVKESHCEIGFEVIHSAQV